MMTTLRELARRAARIDAQLTSDYQLLVNSLQSSLTSVITNEHPRSEVTSQLLTDANQVLDRLEEEFSHANQELDGLEEHSLFMHLIEMETAIEEFGREFEARLNRPTAVVDAMAAVRNMKTVVFESEDSSLVCVIYQDELEIGKDATVMACSHKYHQSCFLQWLQQRNTCPVCRSEVPTV